MKHAKTSLHHRSAKWLALRRFPVTVAAHRGMDRQFGPAATTADMQADTRAGTQRAETITRLGSSRVLRGCAVTENRSFRPGVEGPHEFRRAALLVAARRPAPHDSVRRLLQPL